MSETTFQISQERAIELVQKIFSPSSGGGNVKRHLTEKEHEYIMSQMRLTGKRYTKCIYDIAYPKEPLL